MDNVKRITPEEAQNRLKSEASVRFVDTRNPAAWGESSEKLPGAVRIPVAEAEQHLEKLAHESTIIAYCT